MEARLSEKSVRVTRKAGDCDGLSTRRMEWKRTALIARNKWDKIGESDILQLRHARINLKLIAHP
jgi:hypothetical protein